MLGQIRLPLRVRSEPKQERPLYRRVGDKPGAGRTHVTPAPSVGPWVPSNRAGDSRVVQTRRRQAGFFERILRAIRCCMAIPSFSPILPSGGAAPT